MTEAQIKEIEAARALPRPMMVNIQHIGSSGAHKSTPVDKAYYFQKAETGEKPGPKKERKDKRSKKWTHSGGITGPNKKDVAWWQAQAKKDHTLGAGRLR